MAQEHTQGRQVLVGQLRQHVPRDGILPERILITDQTEAFEPG